MGSSFERSLAALVAPRAVGEMRLWYDSPLLVARAARGRRWFSALTPLGVVAALGCGFGLVLGRDLGAWQAAGLGLGAVTGACLAAAADRMSFLRRSFVVDFDAHTLRLDFTSRWAGAPQTRVVPFAAITSLDVRAGPRGVLGLTVDFEVPGKGPWREVLVWRAFPREAEALEALRRTLEAAFDLAGSGLPAGPG